MNAIGKIDWSVGIVVPAHDEELTVESCIDSIVRSCRHAQLEDFRIVVVADCCSDRTAARAERAVRGVGEVVECNARSAGSARRRGVGRVLAHFSARARNQVWIANTDADTTVPLDWLAIQLALAATGVTAVAGIVRLHESGSTAAHELYRSTYRVRADGTHGHVHGANLSMRADAYLDAGGWSHRPLAEDHCLWERIRRRGWHVCSPIRSVVVTSARLCGRAPGGFADTLRAKLESACGALKTV